MNNRLTFMVLWLVKSFIALTLIFILTTCGNGTEKDNGKEKIIIGLSPSADAERTFERIEKITAYFSEKLDMPVEHKLVSNPSAMIEAMRAKKIHVGSGGPFTYLVAAKVANAEAIVTTQTPEGQPKLYRSCIIAHKDVPINTMEELKERSHEFTLSWAYPTSCSGHLVPRYFMQETYGLYPEDFKEVMISTNHTSAIFTVISKKVDIAAVYYSGLYRFLEEKKIKEEDFKYLWCSEPMLPSPVFIRKDIDLDLREAIQKAYLDMKEDNPETWAVLRNQYMIDIDYIKVSDEDYQFYRDMANEIEGFDVGY